MLSASVEEGGLDRGLEALLVEAERARRHGFLASELEREKTGLLRGYEQAWAERDKTDSGAYASEYVGNFLEDEPIPGIEFEVELARRYVPGITLAEVNHLAETFLQENNRVILVVGVRKWRAPPSRPRRSSSTPSSAWPRSTSRPGRTAWARDRCSPPSSSRSRSSSASSARTSAPPSGGSRTAFASSSSRPTSRTTR